MAINANTTWEVQTGGSDTSGGGFAGNGLTPAPAAPTVAASAGGSIGVATYYYVIAYVAPNTGEGPKSAESAVTTTSSNKTITVTSPAASTYATGYSIYTSVTSGGPYFLQTANTAIGTNVVRTTTPPTSGTQALGVDRSQQTNVQVAIDNATITTSVAASVITFTGYTPTAADVGNVIQIVSGTNMTAGTFFQITAWTATTWTVTGATALPSSGTTTNMVANMGGCFATPGQAGAAKIAGNDVWIKNGTYTLTNTTANSSGGPVTDSTGGANTANYSNWIGYQTTRADGGTRPTISAGAQTNVSIMKMTATNIIFNNIIVDGNSGATNTGLSVTGGTSVDFLNCKAINCSTAGFNVSGVSSAYLFKCLATTNSGPGFTLAAQSDLFACESFSNTSHGFQSTLAGGGVTYNICLAYSNSGTSDGFNATGRYQAYNCIAYGNGRAGFDLPSGGNNANCLLINCISETNTGPGYRTNTVVQDCTMLINCAGNGNNAGVNVGNGTSTNYDTTTIPITNVIGFLTYTGSAFASPGTGNFALNRVASGGNLLVNTGYPGTMPAGTSVGYIDVGGMQTQSLITKANTFYGTTFNGNITIN